MALREQTPALAWCAGSFDISALARQVGKAESKALPENCHWFIVCTYRLKTKDRSISLLSVRWKQASVLIHRNSMSTNTTTQQRKSLLDTNTHRLTKVTNSLSLSLYHLPTGANVYSLPSMCSEFISQTQQLVHPCSPGTSRCCSQVPSSQVWYFDACSGEALL